MMSLHLNGLLPLLIGAAALLAYPAPASASSYPASASASPEARGDGFDVVAGDSLNELSGAQLRSRLLYQADAAARRKRSVPLALGLSAALPGLGQAYNRDWIRSAAAVAVEGALALGYVLWKERGLDGEDAYKAYAHRYWDPAQYAAWLGDYVAFLEQADGGDLGAADIAVPSGIDFSSPESWSVEERQTVRAFFNDVRAVEDVVYHPETGAAFSHNLPYFGEQQYYELIGKYFQFAPGWEDYPHWKEDGMFTDAIDPERTGSDGSKPNVRGRFLEYAEDHADANTLLRRASRVSAFLVLNHVVAAFDAAISAKLHNDRIETDLRVGYDRFDRPHVEASLTWRM